MGGTKCTVTNLSLSFVGQCFSVQWSDLSCYFKSYTSGTDGLVNMKTTIT